MIVFRLFAFAVVALVLLPVTIIGYVWFLVGLVGGVRAGVSMTASKPLTARWLYDRRGARPDPAVGPLLAALPGVSLPALKLIVWPTLVAARLSGFEPRAYRYPIALPSSLMSMFAHRTQFLDAALAEGLREADQVVILGAGWDTRAYGPALRGVRVFEVDAPATQTRKRAAVEEAGLARDHVTFVPVDFTSERWIDRLRDHGFDPGRPTFVLWEGVIYYLTEEAVRETLESVAALPVGSRLAFDYFSAALVERTGGPLYARMATPILNATGEPLLFGVSVTGDSGAGVGELLERHGLRLEGHEPYGDPSDPFGGVAVAVSGGRSEA